MCGIAGVIGARDNTAAHAAVETMLGALSHRGPDGWGVECWDHATLGHRRLAIFDLSDAGRQPMFTDDRRVAVTTSSSFGRYSRVPATASGHVPIRKY